MLLRALLLVLRARGRGREKLKAEAGVVEPARRMRKVHIGTAKRRWRERRMVGGRRQTREGGSESEWAVVWSGGRGRRMRGLERE